MKKLFLIIVLFYCSFIFSSELRDWKSIKESGEIKIGIREGTKLLYNNQDKNNMGFVYDLVQDFAKFHNLKIKFIQLTSFADYWTHNGILVTKLDKIVTPDVYDTIDIASEVFTVTEKRKEYIHMSPYIDNIELFYGRQDTNIKSYEELVGKIIVTFDFMSFSKIIQDTLKKKKIPYKITYIKEKDSKIITPKNHKIEKDMVNLYLHTPGLKVNAGSVYFHVSEKYADIGINDSAGILVNLYGSPYYRKNLKPFFPAQKDKTQLSWGTKKENTELNQKIKEFFEYDKENGNFSKRLEKYTGMTQIEYNQLLNIIE